MHECRSNDQSQVIDESGSHALVNIAAGADALQDLAEVRGGVWVAPASWSAGALSRFGKAGRWFVRRSDDLPVWRRDVGACRL